MFALKRKNTKQLIFSVLFVLFVSFCVISMTSCASLKEGVKGIAGTSTKVLEDGRADAITKDFPYDYFTSYTKSLDALRGFGAYIYAQSLKERMIAIYVSKHDTTPVGIFFKELDANNTQVQVSSPSLTAKGLISTRLFKSLAAQ